jgi:hypothetical protein
MNGFSASYLEIEPRELVRHVLREAGQCDRDSVNPADLLDLLKLQYVSFDFDNELPPEARQTVGGGKPRALISFNDRLVATDESLNHNRTRFSVLHEVGHYVLPNHEHTLYVCDDRGLNFRTRLWMEKEANEFAAELLFLGDRFAVEANSLPVSAATVYQLATKYEASFEATARRLVERNFKSCILVVFKEDSTGARIDSDRQSTWSVRYCIASPLFKTRYFERIQGFVPKEIVATVTTPGRNLVDSVTTEIEIGSPQAGTETSFQAEFFSNTYNIFCLLAPKM